MKNFIPVQDILSTSINDKIPEYNCIKMYEALMSSGNSKIIITDGKTPLINTIDTEVNPKK